jgi:hypothetical protein
VKIFFSGELGGPWMSGWQRCQALRDLGHKIIQFEQGGFLRRATMSKPVRLLTAKYYNEKVIDEFNHSILEATLTARPDLVWLEWPIILRGETLARAAQELPQCTFVSFQDDNPFGSRPGEQERWQCFLEAIPEYDLHFVKRPADVSELLRRGAKEVRRFTHGFYAPLFHPLSAGSIPPAMQQTVSFVGSPLDHRVDMIADLVNRHGVPLRVYGNRWNRTLTYYRHWECFRSEVLAEDYVKVICGSRICLGFVSSSNGDEYSMRTFEVPACKGFFLAERTPTHQALFEEGKEAEFFSSTEECADKIRFYSRNEPARDRVAERGYRRCLDSDYSLHKRLAEALNHLNTKDEAVYF